MSMMSLGRFGDCRLEKGGSFYWIGSFRRPVMGLGFAVWAGIGPERSALPGFCATPR